MSPAVAAETPRSSTRKFWRDKTVYNSKSSAAPTATPQDQRQPDNDVRRKANGLHQSASDVNLPATAIAAEAEVQGEKPGLKRVMSETALPFVDVGTRSQAHVEAEEDVRQYVTQRRPSRLSKQPPKVAVTKYTITEPPTDDNLAKLPKAHLNRSSGDISTKSKSSSSLSTFTRRSSWIIGSRSPSPSNRKSTVNHEVKLEKTGTPKKVPTPIQLPEPLDKAVVANGELSPVKRRGTFGSAKARRPLSAILTSDKSSTRPVIPKSYSTDRLPTTMLSRQLIPDLPTPSHRDRLQAFPVAEPPRKKDELWTVFRTLDGEYSKFNSKPGTLKANIIRTSLLPFLKTYVDHPSNKLLRAEDLDRRVNILNKWWTGLLEMLNGRNGQSVSPNDRPAVLDGLTGIMVRPEWRLSMAAISSRPDRYRIGTAKSPSHSSLESTASDFLAESVLHNVRSLYVQNLLSQMAFVVDRMSLRTVPASVVAFCGKATAYAFFFCPGVADILVRLWKLPQVAMRRVLDENSVPRNVNLRTTSEQMAKFFPSHLRHLVLSSLPLLMRNLRGKSPQSLTLDYIPWYGPWIGRWAGRDSDLFFGFAKQYHILVCEMLPEHATPEERMVAPCAVLVQAQLLAVMDATIHRGSALAQAEAAQSVTFDEILGADASATPLPVHAPNTARLMAENRLIMLLRDFLSTSSAVTDIAKGTFAALFGNLLKAATKRTSLHDHDACFILCDFLEESMFILARFFRGATDPAGFLDWDFWFGVLKRLGCSNNTMIEVRLYSFVYSLWGFIAKDQNKKRDICLDWLLEEDFFYEQFNHWCPMVRGYYQRLLVWRVGRSDNDPTKIDLEIYETLLERLRTQWDHILYKKADAVKKGERPPSTAPATAAPNRRLVIVRDDSVPTPGAVFSALLSLEPNAYEKYSALPENLKNVSSIPEPLESKSPNQSKKRWTFLKSINPFSSSSSNPTNETPRPSTSSTALSRRDSLLYSLPRHDSPSTTPNTSGTNSPSSTRSRPTTPPLMPDRNHRSFKFTLEWMDYSVILRDKKLYTPQLPHTSRAVLMRDADASDEKGPPPERHAGASKYIGVALAEWSKVVDECTNFYERRRIEGVISPRFVETPTLGVESFRRPLG